MLAAIYDGLSIEVSTLAGYDRLYFLKKAWALYPGVVRPISGPFLATHYADRRAGRTAARATVDAVIGALFHAWVPIRARKVQRKFGLDAEWRRRATAIAHARFADPNDIALFRIGEAEEIGHYIRRFEDAAINKRLNPRGWSADCALADKARFAERCRTAGLPHAETVATIDDGKIVVTGDVTNRLLVVKPCDGEGGDGVRMIGPFADTGSAEAALRPTQGNAVVQPLIACHPDIAQIALDALPTVRVVTILDEAGVPEVVSATFRCASKVGARVDNMKAGGLIVPVELATGTLGIACQGYGGSDHIVHPVTAAAIMGRTLPDWTAATALVSRAHALAFDDYIIIGWDVALTPDGPILIEGNGKPGVLMPQRAARRGLGETRYGALIAHHLSTGSAR
ncbi:sugar-transfer associated ATP-grasp domain-containing protein [Sphingomonas montanisoli]|uniref:Alpha-L-glutamate ligase-related protein ATP-grasp domain-containing protein n=1 Tax=Sphingomonas montanisoli TaxID=2606412 RepID=A0A5D9C888_9SPHN|nr:sugar-transfer associated ATP-grasp domain-containing protein [Sphingomonas montanisoli]TZG28108.1 hypothetical protein FYJ91_08015 [Sphingomonas montanisoli]